MQHLPLTDPLAVPSHPPSRFMQRHPLLCLCCYFLMAFVMTWLYLLLVAGPLYLTFPLVFLGSFLRPTAAAFLYCLPPQTARMILQQP